MAGLLDYLAMGTYAANPLSALGQGLLGQVGPSVLDFYKNQPAGPNVSGPQLDQMGNFTGIQNQPPAQNPYPRGADPMTAGGNYAQSGPSSVAPQSLPNPIAVGNYQMPRVGNSDLFEPQQVNTPANAQPAQSQTQQNLPPAFGRNPSGFLDQINNRLQSIGNGGSVIGALTGTLTDPQSVAQQNLKAQYDALAPIVGPQKAMLAILNSKAGESIFKGEFDNPKTVEGVIAERMRENKGGVNAGLADYAKFLQTKNQAEKAGSTLGEQQATAQLNLPSAVAQSKEALSIADRLLSHKGREGNPFFHGKASSYLGDALIPGNTDAYDANSLLGQLKGGAFLNAYATLRGGGQISNAEGAKAEQAILRANRAQSKQEFDQAINDFKSSLRLAIDNANYRAGNAPPYGFQGSQLNVGDTTTINGMQVRRIK